MSKRVFAVEDEEHLIALRNTLRKVAADIGMRPVNQTKLITVASELGRNMLRYGGGGQVTVDVRQALDKQGVQLTFIDQGPGIANVDEAMQDGYSSGRGLGLGLPGSRRLSDEFRIESVVGQGTTVTITKW